MVNWFYFYIYYITSQSLYSITRRIRISRLTTTPGSTTPTLYEQCVGSLTSHSINIGKDCETGPTVFRPYPRRLESLTICRCHYKGSTFFSVIVKTLQFKAACPTSTGLCHVRDSKTVSESGFQEMDSGFQVLDFRFQILDSGFFVSGT